MFWILNLIFNVVTLIAVIFIESGYTYNAEGRCNDTNNENCEPLGAPVYSIISITFYLVANLLLIVCLVMTKRRSRHNPRYTGNYIDEDLLLSTPRNKA
jgi:hypothetical protein